MSVNGTTKIGDILKTYPESLDVFLSNGFYYDTKEEFLQAVGEQTMLQTLTKVRNLNLELFLFHLDNNILKAEAEKKYILEDFDINDSLDFYGNTICPLKFTFRDALEDLEREYAKNNGFSRKCYLEFGKMTDDSCDERWSNPNPNSFPGLMFSKEFNEYLGLDFQKRMSGMFVGDFYQKTNPALELAGLRDPLRQYIVYGVMADTFLVDKNHLGDLPVPRTLADLLNPIYKDNIIIFGKDQKEMSNATFLYIYKEFGEEGVRQFAHNVKHSLHGSVMSKTAGSKRKEGAAIYIVSWFFAQTCVKENVEIIWPDDGAMTLPMYMLVRGDAAERVSDIVQYVVGDTFAQACVNAYTPPMNGNVDAKLPPNASFRWLGWDYIRENDIPALAERCIDIFTEEWYKIHKEGVLFP